MTTFIVNLVVLAVAFLIAVYGLPLVLQVIVSPLLGWIAARTFKEWETDLDR